jgi:hypothetical protein
MYHVNDEMVEHQQYLSQYGHHVCFVLCEKIDIVFDCNLMTPASFSPRKLDYGSI